MLSTYRNCLQQDATSTLVLERHQLLGMFPLLVRVQLEELGKSFQGNIVTVKVIRLKTTRRKSAIKPCNCRSTHL